MRSRNEKLAQICTAGAGFILLGETLFGCIAVLGIGFNSAQDIILDLCLTMAFPIFLISLANRFAALIGLWGFFIAQWVDMCLIGSPPALLNPLDGWHGDALLIGVLLFTISYILHRRNDAAWHSKSPEVQDHHARQEIGKENSR